MKMTLAISLLMTFTQCVLAAPPDLECLTDMPFEDVFCHKTQIEGRLIILVGDPVDSQTKTNWSLWNDPVVVKFLKERDLIVTYLDEGTTDRSYLWALNPKTRPMVIYRDRRGKQHRRSVESLPSTASGLVDWLKYPTLQADIRRQRESQLLDSISRNPDDIVPRMQLIDLRRIESGPPFMVYALYPWLFSHNEQWFSYSVSSCGVTDEESFRKFIFNEIRSARNFLELFKQPVVIRRHGESDITKEFESWIEEQLWRSNQFGQGIQIPPIGVVRQWAFMVDKFSKSCQLPTATDRDLFILKALTAEGEEWEAMIEQYSYDSP